MGGAVVVVHALRLAVVVTKRELAYVAVQVLRADVLVHAANTHLQSAEEAFDAVGSHITASVFLDRMVDGLVRPEACRRLLIELRLIGHEARALVDLRLKQRLQGICGDARDMKRADVALALNQRDNFLLFAAVRALAKSLVLAEIGFIGFDNAASAFAAEFLALIFSHGKANAMAHKPCSFESDAKNPVELVRADAFLARGNQVDRLQPQVKLNLAVLEDGPDSHGERLAALVALIDAKAGAIAIQLADALHSAAARARSTIRPYARFNEGERSFFVVEVRG